MTADPTPAPRPDLRARKKQRTRAAIRKATCRLAAEQGWGSVTTERIASAAEVSPSTVVRYFPVREDILLGDGNDSLLEARLRARPTDEQPLESLRAVLLDAVRTAQADEPEDTRLRARLAAEIPSVRARLTETTAETSRRLAHALAARTGRDADDLEVRVLTAAVLASVREATALWAERGGRDALLPLLDRAVDTLRDGLSL
ncbi:TetR family transcriptional regulator [Streptomyces sp. NBC_01216]|uniref:acyl-CoA-like ligand-binding transcription factor n=1 Tax=unclassified Streptomyces TaxID=2593676 RepID=UPI002E0EA655